MTLDNGSQNTMTLMRMSHGGYVVYQRFSDIGYSPAVFASTSIDEAIGFIRDKVRPTEGPQTPKGG